MARQHYISFRNIYCVGSIVIAAVTMDISEMVCAVLVLSPAVHAPSRQQVSSNLVTTVRRSGYCSDSHIFLSTVLPTPRGYVQVEYAVLLLHLAVCRSMSAHHLAEVRHI